MQACNMFLPKTFRTWYKGLEGEIFPTDHKVWAPVSPPEAQHTPSHRRFSWHHAMEVERIKDQNCLTWEGCHGNCTG